MSCQKMLLFLLKNLKKTEKIFHINEDSNDFSSGNICILDRREYIKWKVFLLKENPIEPMKRFLLENKFYGNIIWL